MLYALQKFAEMNNIEIRENTEVTDLLTENGKTIIAETANEKFAAGKGDSYNRCVDIAPSKPMNLFCRK